MQISRKRGGTRYKPVSITAERGYDDFVVPAWDKNGFLFGKNAGKFNPKSKLCARRAVVFDRRSRGPISPIEFCR